MTEEIEKTRKIALDLLARHDWSVRDMRARLARRGCPDDAADAVVASLQEAGLLDDEAFARRWIGSKLDYKPEGRTKLMQDLTRKGIDRSLTERILQEYGDRVGSDEGADQVLDRVRDRYAGLDADKARRRMFGLLARRGFDPDTARAAVERALADVEAAGAE